MAPEDRDTAMISDDDYNDYGVDASVGNAERDAQDDFDERKMIVVKYEDDMMSMFSSDLNTFLL